MDDASPNDGETFPGAARQLHVSNIPFELGAEALANIFAGVPGVVQTQMPVERDTGKPKGFGFVRFDVRVSFSRVATWRVPKPF